MGSISTATRTWARQMASTSNVLLSAFSACFAVTISVQFRDPFLVLVSECSCSSAGYTMRLTEVIPLFLCKPSQFVLIRYFKIPRFCNSAKAICVGVGIAWSVFTTSPVRCLPCALRVHAPSGPRKSGSPAEVETPAPVKTMKCLLFLI
jgi:hypothetical protein